MHRISVAGALFAAGLALVGCTPAATTAAPPAPAPVEAPAPLLAGEGEPQTTNPVAPDDPALAVLGVVKFDDLADMASVGAVRLFGVGGGDQAMNGLKVYLAFVAPHDERAFLLGDFRDYRVIAASPGRIDLEYVEDFMVGDEPQTRTLRAIVSWTEVAQEASPNPEFPSMVTMTPAQ